MNFSETFKNNDLKAIQVKYNLTNKEYSTILGITRQALHNLYTGASKISYDIQRKALEFDRESSQSNSASDLTSDEREFVCLLRLLNSNEKNDLWQRAALVVAKKRKFL